MSIQQQLSIITNTRASLDKKKRELERLRDQVKKAELLVEDNGQCPMLVASRSDSAALSF
jgi:hypothetical protein